MVSDFGEGITSQDHTIAGERKDPRHDPATTGGTVLGSVHPPAYGRGLLVSIVAAAIVFALAIFASGGQEEYTGIPMTQTTGSLFWGLSILAIILVGVASQYAEGAAIGSPSRSGKNRRGEASCHRPGRSRRHRWPPRYSWSRPITTRSC